MGNPKGVVTGFPHPLPLWKGSSSWAGRLCPCLSNNSPGCQHTSWLRISVLLDRLSFSLGAERQMMRVYFFHAQAMAPTPRPPLAKGKGVPGSWPLPSRRGCPYFLPAHASTAKGAAQVGVGEGHLLCAGLVFSGTHTHTRESRKPELRLKRQSASLHIHCGQHEQHRGGPPRALPQISSITGAH